MGYYINIDSKGNFLPARGKALALIADGAIEVERDKFVENLVCVVSNGPFDAAGYVFSESELAHFTDPRDTRYKVWLVYDHARELSGYKQHHDETLQS